MLLRKQNPITPQRSSDVSMRPQNYTLQPFVSKVRGRKVYGSKEKPVTASSFVLNDCADDYKLESLLQAGIVPQEINRPYFSPTIDDFSELQKQLPNEELIAIEREQSVNSVDNSDNSDNSNN